MAFDPLPAARALQQSRRDRVVVAPLPAGIAPANAEEGAEVQRALAGLAGAVPPAGRSSVSIGGFVPAGREDADQGGPETGHEQGRQHL